MKLHVMLASVWSALTMGQAVKASSLPVTMASDQPPISTRRVGEYETVAASQTAQAIGATGAVGDYMQKVTIIPATTSPGNVILKDGSTSITIFTGGATSVADLKPFEVVIEAVSVNTGGWAITTGANVSVIAHGDFT